MSQLVGWEDYQHPNYVDKLDKALYSLNQAHHVRSATLPEHLLAHGYTWGTINEILFIKRVDKDQTLIQSM